MEILKSKINAKKCLIVMPAYNEADSLPSVIEDWNKVLEEIDGSLLIINDGSKDKTFEILKNFQKKYDRLIVINKVNSGHGSTCIDGYNWGIENAYEWIFQTDSDGQTQAKEFIDMWVSKKNHPFIFGYRPKRGDGFSRWFISKVFKLLILIIFKVNVKDANVPFRLMRGELLKKYLTYIPDDMLLKNALLTILLQKDNQIKWKKISFSSRIGGKPSVHWVNFITIGLKVIKEYWSARKILKKNTF